MTANNYFYSFQSGPITVSKLGGNYTSDHWTCVKFLILGSENLIFSNNAIYEFRIETYLKDLHMYINETCL